MVTRIDDNRFRDFRANRLKGIGMKVMETKQLFNDNWEFALGESPKHFSPVEIPNDWLIYDTNNLYKSDMGCYKKEFTLTQNEIKNKRLALRFEGIYMDCEIWVNSKKAGEWKYGYSTFEIEITEMIREGNNQVLVKVNYQSPNSRWYSGAGIYRNVWLIATALRYIPTDGIYISTKNCHDHWQIEIETELNQADTAASHLGELRIEHKIYDPFGHCIAESSCRKIENSIKMQKDTQTISVKHPRLWDITTPNCYTLHTSLIAGADIIQYETTSFGFRTIEFNPGLGLLLNGNLIKIHGVCEHHDLGCLGAAINKHALKRRFHLLKEMGVNAIRTSHNPPAKEVMELADEMGVLICSEAFDMWERSKTTYDYARFFSEWVEKDVESWIRRDRNHPSLIMWSIGNEIYDTHAGVRGQELTSMLKALVLQHDPKENGKVTIGSNYMPWENARKCADIVKLAGYNYAEKYYEEHHLEHPDWIIYGSETSSTVQSRGIYHFPLAQSLLSDDDEQCSSLGNSSTSWGAKNTEWCIIDDRDAAFSFGMFIWTGFDYIGEPTPYFTKNSYFGQLDTAGFKKDSFYIYQAEWTNYKTNPMIHIFPYWDFSDGQQIDVRVCSNAPKIELFFNDISKGIVTIDHVDGQKLLGEWQIPYLPGSLCAVAYDENGNFLAQDKRHSFTDAKRLVLKPEKEKLIADGSDLIFVEISTVDENGFPVENANNRVDVSVSGAGRLIGLDNGDSTDYDQYKGTSRRLFSGKLIAVIAATYQTGEVRMEVSSPELPTECILFTAIPIPIAKEDLPHHLKGKTTVFPENKKSAAIYEIPIRKIEIISPDGTCLNESLSEVTVEAKLYPVNATYSDVEWRVTNDKGIDSNLAIIKPDGLKAKIMALGDGLVRLRCCCKNGSDKVKIISQFEFQITGLGAAYLNPYEFISGGMYTHSNVPLANGNDRGVSTLRDGESHVSFTGIDFGEYGSDEITIPIFCLDSEKLPIEIWEGIPGEMGSELLTTVVYHKQSRWNTYQEETYRLPKRLKGITAITFVLQRKIHLKGFSFTMPKKAYETLYAIESNHIYGDTFHILPDSVTGIGNNVSLEFDHMDFSEKGISKLIICGRSPIDKNTIHVCFSSESGESRQLVDFLYSEEYQEREFVLENVIGENKVTFVFLPGCSFDFKWFRFC